MLDYVLTAWGRLGADDYADMRQTRIRLPQASRAAEFGETQERPECCLCPQHGRLTA